MRGSQQSGVCANNLEEDAAVMPSGTGLEVRIDGLREQEARRMHGRKAVDQVLCETGGGGGGDERGAEEEQAGRVAFARRAWRRRGEPSAPAAAIGSWQAGAGEEAEEEASRGGRRGLLRGLLRGDRPASLQSFLKRVNSDRTSTPC